MRDLKKFDLIDRAVNGMRKFLFDGGRLMEHVAVPEVRMAEFIYIYLIFAVILLIISFIVEEGREANLGLTIIGHLLWPLPVIAILALIARNKIAGMRSNKHA